MSIKLALELPTPYLKRFSEYLDLHFVLAHKVLQDAKYAQFYRSEAEKDRPKELILDNSTHEFGKPMKLEELELAAKSIRADYLIAPDIVVGEKNPDEQVRTNLRWVTETCKAFHQHPFNIAAVICGNDKDQFEQYLDECTDSLVEMICFTFHNPNRLTWWKWFDEFDGPSMFNRVHLLGMHTKDELKRWVEIAHDHANLVEFSFDTSKPLKFGVQCVELDKIEDLRGGPIRSKEVLDLGELTDEQIGCCVHNIQYLKRICQGRA